MILTAEQDTFCHVCGGKIKEGEKYYNVLDLNECEDCLNEDNPHIIRFI